MVDMEAIAQQIAELINGGRWDDKQFYTDEQKALWRNHAQTIFSIVHDEIEADYDPPRDW